MTFLQTLNHLPERFAAHSIASSLEAFGTDHRWLHILKPYIHADRHGSTRRASRH